MTRLTAHVAICLMLSMAAQSLPAAPLPFAPQAAAASSNAFDLTGCLLQKGNSAVLVDPTGTMVFELSSTKKTKLGRAEIGNTFRIVGALDPSATPSSQSGAQQVLVIGAMKRTKKGGCTDLATKVGASVVPQGAIIVPVATGAAAAAAAAVGSITDR